MKKEAKKILIVNTHPGRNRYIEFLEKLLKKLNKPIKIKVINGFDFYSPIKFNPTHIILSPVPVANNYSLNDEHTKKLIKKNYSWLKKTKCPVLGVCYGMQIIATVFGGENSRLKKTRKNQKYQLHLDEDKDIFKGIKTLKVRASHKNYISKMPRNFKLVAQAKGAPYIIYNKKRKIYGFQFHPCSNNGLKLLKRFLESKK